MFELVALVTIVLVAVSTLWSRPLAIGGRPPAEMWICSGLDTWLAHKKLNEIVLASQDLASFRKAIAENAATLSTALPALHPLTPEQVVRLLGRDDVSTHVLRAAFLRCPGCNPIAQYGQRGAKIIRPSETGVRLLKLLELT